MFCAECNKRNTCETICEPLNDYLNKNRYTKGHIKRMEISTNPNTIDNWNGKKGYEKSAGGYHKIPNHPEF